MPTGASAKRSITGYTGRHPVEHRLHLTRIRPVQPEVCEQYDHCDKLVPQCPHFANEVLAHVRLTLVRGGAHLAAGTAGSRSPLPVFSRPETDGFSRSRKHASTPLRLRTPSQQVNGGDNGSKQKASYPTKKKVNGAREGAQVLQVRTQ